MNNRIATAGMSRRLDWMSEKLDRVEHLLKEILSKQEKIYKYTVVPNESTSVSSVIEQVDDHDYESTENKRFRGKPV